jgi:peptidoglycan hydrolase-like protein with peptidoglycan-binding domain
MKKVLIVASLVMVSVVSLVSAQGFAFNVNLSVGRSGTDVAALQTALISAGFPIPAIVSGVASKGYFGTQTRLAVMRYQASRGIPNTGFVGPLTRAALNRAAPATSNANNTFVMGCPIGYTCTPLATSSSSSSNTAGSNSSSNSSSNNTNTSTKDTTSPSITDIEITSIGTSTARIDWRTNEAATTKIEIGTSVIYGTVVASSSALTLTHGATTTGLQANRTYYYRLISRDAAGNSRTRSGTFVTAALQVIPVVTDTTAPVISGFVAAENGTSVTVVWTTDEPSTTNLRYRDPSTSVPYTNYDNSALVTVHSIPLNGFLPGTPYEFYANSTDAAGNISATQSTLIVIDGAMSTPTPTPTPTESP